MSHSDGLLAAAKILILALADAADVDLTETFIDVNAHALDGSTRRLVRMSADDFLSKCDAAIADAQASAGPAT